MRILFITLLLVGCPDKDDPKNIDPESTTSPSPDTTQQPSPTNTQTKTTPPPPPPPQTGFALNVVGTKEKLSDTLEIGSQGAAILIPADPTRYGDDVKFSLRGCTKPGLMRLLPMGLLDYGTSFPYELEGQVGDLTYFHVIDTSGAKDAVTGCVLRASVIARSGAVTNIEKPVTVRAGKLRLSNPTLTAAGVITATVEAMSGTPEAYVNFTVVLWVGQDGRYLPMAHSKDDHPVTPNTPSSVTIDTFVVGWGDGESKEETVLEQGTYIILLGVSDKQDGGPGPEGITFWALGSIAVSL